MLVNLLAILSLAALTKASLAIEKNSEPRRLHSRQLGEHRDTDCAGYALNRGTWAELGIDNYLLHYPRGQNISVTEYTDSLKVLNFECGIGLTCLSGQLCHPVRGRDWVVLSALQEWNFYINSMYEAVGSAMSIVQGSAAAMVADFLPEGPDKKLITVLTLGLLGLSGVILLGFTSALLVPILWQVLRMTWFAIAWTATTTGSAVAAGWVWLTSLGAEETFTIAGTEAVGETVAAGAGTAAIEQGVAAGATEGAIQTSAQNSAEGALVTNTAKAESEVASAEAAAQAGGSKSGVEAAEQNLAGNLEADLGGQRLRKRHHHNDGISHDKFQMWSSVNAHLAVLQDRLQAVLSLEAELTLTSPISSPQGIFGALQNGTFLSEHPPRAVLQDNVAEAAQLSALAQLFKAMNMMFVIDSVPCQQEGPTTPMKKPEAVHFCSPEGVKTSLGRVQKEKIDYKVRNGRLIFSKYSYSTEFLSQLATDCQTQRAAQGSGSSNGTLAVIKTGPELAQSMNHLNSTGNISAQMNATMPSGGLPATNTTALNKEPLSSTILLPDGTSVCSFPIPICDLRLPEVKSLISSGKTPADACREGLKLDI
ncbi:hypothetical protein CROQUDRAFT_50448 [Cronartium quercuum f. sp. fusiforme G11]|uniref:DUF7872 domain-containing protein n=1 Tax=Cronartium quercuum f. sp. fusiforme G11 TaxID=708437 RepID=A0A9P6NB18_9BASI|nr:hypothetical protein CROQUDRAFT_50448 [Cronartium quercuum f. sp. fusiforme G11]